MNYNNYISDKEFYGPLPSRTMDFGLAKHVKPKPKIECVTDSIKLCSSRFSGNALRSCIDGVLVNNGLQRSTTAINKNAYAYANSMKRCSAFEHHFLTLY